MPWFSKKRTQAVDLSPSAEYQQGTIGGTRSRLEMIAPDGVSMPDDPGGYGVPKGDFSYIQFGHDRYSRSFVITDPPRQLFVGFLRDLDVLGDLDRSVHLFVPEQQQVVSDLTREIVRLETESILRGNSISESDAVLRQSILDTEALRDQISLGQDKMFYATIVLTLSAESLEELNRKHRMLYEIAGEKLMHVRECFMRQDEGIRATAPIAVNPMSDLYRNLNLGAATALFPFDTQDLSDPDGLFLGENLFTGAPVFFNNFRQSLESSHTLVVGRPGSGKTTAVMTMILRSAAQGVRNWVIDPEGEYKDVTERVGGQYFIFRPDMEPAINPFDLEEEELFDGTKRVDILSKLEQSKDLLIVMMSRMDDRSPLSPEEDTLLERAIANDYSTRGITTEPSSLYEEDPRPDHVGLRRKEMPTISSISDRLREEFGEPGEKLALRLATFRRGGTMGIFDGQTRLDIANAPAVSFGLSALDNAGLLKHIAMHVLQQFIWEKFVKKNPKQQKRVIVDEAWMFTRSLHSLRFFELMARRARKRNCSFLVSTQSFREFLGTEEGRAVLQAATVTLLMKQSITDMDDLRQLYKLPRGQLDFLVSSDKGQGLLRMGGQTTGVQVRIMPHEEAYVFGRELVS